jgi:ATP-dependent RNA helicase DeaD
MKATQKNSKFDNFSPFRELGLDEPILRSIKQQKFEQPTLIQKKSIPLALAGKDIIAGSSTGSGKTLAFGAGIIQNSQRGSGVQSLILTPTRELAEQVAKSLKVFSSHQSLRVVAVYGGVSINPQIKELKRADVVVGTPGRILDHINRRTIRLGKLKTLVLDEADTMLDMGFIVDVEKIIKGCPKNRQTLLFSATITDEIKDLAKRHTKEAVKIFTNKLVDPRKLTQVCYNVSKGLKFSLLVHLLKHEKAKLVMVFCNTRRNTDLVAKKLKGFGIEAIAIHGGFPQHKRSKVIKRFHTNKVHVLVCTDVAARGLDINGVSHVYNYDIPMDSKQYIHRIGRTARAGKEGKAISILTMREQGNFSKVLRDNSIDIARKKTPSIERTRIGSN